MFITMFVLMCIGLATILVGALYAVRHPRRKEEPWSAERKRQLVIVVVGGAVAVLSGSWMVLRALDLL
jgi:uncharacterized membrane protein YsdA (DUF1294 family)